MTEATPRRVNCPRCRSATVYAPSNPWRPFCSERCAGIDLGAWASEAYRVEAAASADDPARSPDPGEAPADPRH